MFQTLVNAFKQKDLRKKLFIILGLLLVYRIGCWIPVPGLNISTFVSGEGYSDFLKLMSSVSGGALSNGSILALGVIPYISASIIMQLLTIAFPRLQRLAQSGEEGRKKMAWYTRITALIFATCQAVAIVIAFDTNDTKSAIISNVFGAGTPAWIVPTMIAIILVAGSMFTLWIGEKITDLGIGNGVSLLIFVGILSSAGSSILTAISSIGENIDNLWNLIIYALLMVVIFALIVFVDLAERRIPVQYAKQIKGRKMYGGQSTNIPIKVNANGVLPIIFATCLVSFPQLILSIFNLNGDAYKWYSQYLGTGSVWYYLANAVLIFFFSYFYSQLTFNPEEVSRNLQQNGGFIPGYRSGRDTKDYLTKVSRRITFFGALYLSIIFVIPSVAMWAIQGGVTGTLLNAFSVTGLLIVVSVALEFDKQLDAQMLMKSYRGFLK